MTERPDTVDKWNMTLLENFISGMRRKGLVFCYFDRTWCEADVKDILEEIGKFVASLPVTKIKKRRITEVSHKVI